MADLENLMTELGIKEDELDDIVFEEAQVPPAAAPRWLAIGRIHTTKEVIIDVRKPLKNHVSVVKEKKRQIFRVKYERLPDWCAVCGMIGHLYTEHGDGVHAPETMIFKDLRASWRGAWKGKTQDQKEPESTPPVSQATKNMEVDGTEAHMSVHDKDDPSKKRNIDDGLPAGNEIVQRSASAPSPFVPAVPPSPPPKHDPKRSKTGVQEPPTIPPSSLEDLDVPPVSVKGKTPVGPTNAHEIIAVGQGRTWSKPQAGWTKLNCDGSFDDKAAAGSGLSLALSRTELPIAIEMDSLLAVKMIQSRDDDRSLYCSLVREIKHLRSLRETSITHIYRQQNRVSNSLANFARSEARTITWLGSGPTEVLELNASDCNPDVLDPLGAPTSMARLLSLVEDVATQTGLSSTAGASRLGRWVAKEDDGAVYLKVPMPGLTKEHVQVRADKNILVIKGEGEKQPWDGDDDSAVRRYNHRIEIPADAYKMDKIKAEMKNGVLWVTLIKLKEEERKDVFHVKVE
ncbi:23.5 kDa heat-shock protein [Hordeum vulgare]|nr:23.5 kDa heat-shock protein [Hordeum vulgare]